MASLKLAPVLNKFNSEISRSFKLIRHINSLNPPLQQKYVFLIVELSFLKVYSAWEQFLEDSFIKYMRGGKTSSGYKATRYVLPKNQVCALEMLNEGRDHSNWGPDEVIRKGNRFFKDGKPYKQAIQPIIPQLNDMKCIRNRIAHNSHKSKKSFESLVYNELTYVPQRITPGEFLLKIKSRRPLKTFIVFYIYHLEYASKNIVP